MSKSENHIKRSIDFFNSGRSRIQYLLFKSFNFITRRLLLLTFLLCHVCFVSFSQDNTKTFDDVLKITYQNTVPLITSSQLSSELQKDSSVIILDAREKREFEVSHIQNARYVGFKDFKFDWLSDVSKDRKIIIYCSVGQRSEMIGEMLLKAGYEKVYNLYGGIFAWVNSEYPVYDIKNKRTFKVHTYSDEWGVWLKKGEKEYE